MVRFGIKKGKRVLSVLSFCVVFLILCELLNVKQDSCQEEDSMLQIQLLCSQYHNKEIVGNMCSSLCDQSVFSFHRCHGNRKRGKRVIIMTCDGCITPGKTSTVILKFKYHMDKWYRAINTNLSALHTTEEKIFSSNNEIKIHTKEHFDTVLLEQKDLISLMLGEHYTKIVKRLNTPNALDIVLRTAIALGTQEEFSFNKLLGSRSFFPKVYGVCGPAYFVENTPSFSTLNYIYFVAKNPDLLRLSLVNSPPWRDRANAALSLLKMVPAIEDNYEIPIQICDVKPHNFGLSESGEVVMLDSDNLKFGHVLDKDSCWRDHDCLFVTCQTRCNRTTFTCEKEMSTNNLQVICKELFVSIVQIFGLLRSPPPSIQEPLRKVLYQCMYPQPEIFKLPNENKSDRNILKRLEILLRTTI